MLLKFYLVLGVYDVLTNLKQDNKIAKYVLVHVAWHTGELLEDTTAPIRSAGHYVYLPTIRGIPRLLD